MAIPAYIISPLADVLAELCPDPASTRAIALTAGLTLWQIPLDPKASNTWVFLLNEAEAQDRTAALLERAASQYPVEKRLRAASQDYADWVAAGRPSQPVQRAQPLSTTSVLEVQSTAGQLFLSYSRHDRGYVKRLAADLRAHGFGTWYDDRINLGERWWPTIEKSIDECVAKVVVMSPEAQASSWVRRDILLAERQHKPILPLLLRGEGLSLLIDHQYVDVRGGQLPPVNFYTRLHRVVPLASEAVPVAVPAVLGLLNGPQSSTSSITPSSVPAVSGPRCTSATAPPTNPRTMTTIPTSLVVATATPTRWNYVSFSK